MKINKKKDINPKYLLLFFSVISLILLFISYFSPASIRPIKEYMGKLVIPMQQGVNRIGEWFSDKSNIIAEKKALIEENEQLKKEIKAYKAESSKYETELNELSRLRELYSLDNLYPDYNKTAARVFSTNSLSWFNEFYIDKGLNDGVYEECNVLCDDGLLGIVVEAYDNYSKVRAIVDDRQNVSCEILPSSSIGNVEGNLDTIKDGYIFITDIDKDADISVGDRVVTSSFSDRYFYGITIGYITEISMDSNNLTKSARLTPAVDFSNVTEVLVITDRKQEVNY